MKSRKSNKDQREEFAKGLVGILGREPDEINSIGVMEWKLNTRYGEVRISARPSDSLGSVNIRFLQGGSWQEAEQSDWFKRFGGPAVMDASRSGKWNICYGSSAEFMEGTLLELQRRYDQLEVIHSDEKLFAYLDQVEEKTALCFDIIADGVFGEGWIIAKNNGVNIPEEERELSIRILKRRMATCMQADEKFKRKIHGKGNTGRDWSYTFMRHWLTGRLHRKFHVDRWAIPDWFSLGKGEKPADFGLTASAFVE